MVLGLYYLTFNRDEYKGPAKGEMADDQIFADSVGQDGSRATSATATIKEPRSALQDAVLAYEAH